MNVVHTRSALPAAERDAAGGGGAVADARPCRLGPAPIASFDHDVSDESSPEAKMTFQLPEIREHRAATPAGSAPSTTGGGLGACAAPRIDISRASSSSHHDSRDSSPELFALPDGQRGLGFQEDGALELRSSTEELAFLEPDSQPVGRSTRGSSIGSVGSALSSISRAASPNRVLRETSFCGPKPLAAEPEPTPRDAARALSRPELLPDSPTGEPIGGLSRPELLTHATETRAPSVPNDSNKHTESPVLATSIGPPDTHRLLTAATVEPMMRRASAPAPAPSPDAPVTDVRQPRRRPRRRSDITSDEPVVYRPENRDKSIIRIRLKPDDQYDDPDDDLDDEPALASAPVHPLPTPVAASARSLAPSPSPSRRSSPTASRKSSFCSLFRRSPEPPASRDRSVTPPSKPRGSVLALFRSTPRRSPVIVLRSQPAPSPETDTLRYYQSAADGVIHIPLRSPPEERASVPSIVPLCVPVSASPDTTPTITATTATTPTTTATTHTTTATTHTTTATTHTTTATTHTTTGGTWGGARERTVLPDGSVIIPLHSPTDGTYPESELTDHNEGLGMTDVRQVDASQIWQKSEPDIIQEGAPGIKQGGELTEGIPEPIETTFEFDFGALDREIAAYLANGSPMADEPNTLSEPNDEECGVGGDGDAERSSASDLGSSPEEPDRRRLVADSDEELPFVATTLPQERSLAWPMRPVRNRSPPAPRAPRRPRAPPPPPDALERFTRACPPAPAAQPLRVRLPPQSRRAPAPAPWVDVATAPERRPPARRIQTVPAPVSFVEPAECRCECHRSPGADEDELPLLRSRHSRGPADGCTSDSSAEGGALPADVVVVANIADTSYREERA